MKKTHIVCIIDNSGSMSYVASNVIKSFNIFLKDQQDERGEALLTVVLYNSYHTTICDRVDIKSALPLNQNTYIAKGMTAMYDAIGHTLDKIKDDDVYVVIQTDGKENDSETYTSDMIINLVGEKRRKGWDFLFMGADIDVKKAAIKIGLEDKSEEFDKNSKGIEVAFSTMSGKASNYRASLDKTILRPASYSK